ncbi:AAA family ATPase [Streptomyces sp. Go40/10]|uniref:AAA family ATPase n=1 Tax=Streptomyces sp. Go40/10 TaxID=2825844 RepID=UPI00273A36C9|nr:MoxR family ATPase [Streptomyces sp. Go40/10]
MSNDEHGTAEGTAGTSWTGEEETVAPPPWWIYQGTGQPHDGIRRLPGPPPWRAFDALDSDAELPAPPHHADALSERKLGRARQAAAYRADDREIHLVNLALYLRRPLLVTGRPGVGKSTLAYSIARELGLGPVLRWPITSRSTLQDGLYHYDAIGRLQEAGLRFRCAGGTEAAAPPDIGPYLRLGPLGTALLPWRFPRVLLVDEIDKSDIDLPNDLLNVFEDGEFTIPELSRLGETPTSIMSADNGAWVTVLGGQVRCAQFPLMVLTSNSEREFPPAFLRRCLRLEIAAPSDKKIAGMVTAHFSGSDRLESLPEAVRADVVAEFVAKQRDRGAELASDQLLNALLMASHGLWSDPKSRKVIENNVLHPLNEG